MSKAKDHKELNFELDLLPVISMMSVCICFLLLTAVWTHVGSLNIQQGLGQESLSQVPNGASLWVTVHANGQMQFSLKDAQGAPKNLLEQTFQFERAQDWSAIDSYTSDLKQALPQLKTALIMPEGRVSYGQVVRLMDKLKGKNISDVGIAPLTGI